MVKQLTAVLAAACVQGASLAQVPVIPAPRVVETRAGSFRLTPESLVGGDAPEVVRQAIQALELGDAGMNSKVAVRFERVTADPSLGAEGYTLDVEPNGIIIRAATEAGLFYGLQTLCQMVGADGEVPLAHIADRPRFAHRGLMLDGGRHMQPIAFIKSYLDRMAELKLNRFHWHLTEDQGWRIQIDQYPELTRTGAFRTRDGQRYGGFYTKEQIREVVAHAKSRFITIVPEIDMPGHMQAAVASYPNLGCTGETLPVRWDWGISDEVLCAGQESTYEFCEKVLDEVIDLFPDSPVIHIGGDECPKGRWKACPKCQEKIKSLGLKDEHALQLHFTARMARYLESKGRRLQGWNEIMEGGDLPPGVIVQQWNAPAAATQAANAGLDVVVSPTSHSYFDYPYSRIWVRKVYEFEPVPADLPGELHPRILGPQGNLWTEHLETSADVDYMTWPRAVAMAEVGWSVPERKSWDDFRKRCEAWIERQPEALRPGLRERLVLYADTSKAK